MGDLVEEKEFELVKCRLRDINIYNFLNSLKSEMSNFVFKK